LLISIISCSNLDFLAFRFSRGISFNNDFCATVSKDAVLYCTERLDVAQLKNIVEISGITPICAFILESVSLVKFIPKTFVSKSSSIAKLLLLDDIRFQLLYRLVCKSVFMEFKVDRSEFKVDRFVCKFCKSTYNWSFFAFSSGEVYHCVCGFSNVVSNEGTITVVVFKFSIILLITVIVSCFF
jgi:hypothetical protein